MDKRGRESVWVDPDLHRRLKVEAARQDRTMADILDGMIARWLHFNEGAEPPNGPRDD